MIRRIIQLFGIVDSIIGDWLLEDNVWDDTGIWRDTETWID